MNKQIELHDKVYNLLAWIEQDIPIEELEVLLKDKLFIEMFDAMWLFGWEG